VKLAQGAAMSDTTTEERAQDRMTWEGSPPPRAAAPQAPNRRSAAQLRAAIGRLRRATVVAAGWARVAGAFAGVRVRSAWSHRAVRITAAALAALFLVPTGWLVHHVYFDRNSLPDIEPFIRFDPPTIGEVYDAQGTVLIQLAREYRRVVSYDEVPLVVRDAVLAAEDKNFYSHSGVDYAALPRVIHKATARSYASWRGGKGLRLLLPQGGSTITQQLVRVYFLHDLTSRRDDDAVFHEGLGMPRLLSSVLGAPATNKLLRKLEEVRLALWLEEAMRRRYGTRERAKREIFSRYASFIYLGSGRYGFAAGSEYYFDKPLSSYTLQDAGNAALLAGIAKSPRDYAPMAGDPRPLRRRNEILALMARNGTLHEDVARRCQAEPVRVARHAVAKTAAPSAIGHVFDELQQRGGSRFAIEDLFQGKISVRSTVDDRVQAIVNEALENGLALYEKRHPRAKGLTQGSVVVLGNADSAVLAEVGGRQVYKLSHNRYSDYNRVTGSLRQPGSAMKPLVYLAAFRRGLTLDTIVPDEPIAVPLGTDHSLKWIANYDKLFKGPIPLRQALAESRNAVAVWTAREIGVGKVIQAARELGIRTPLQPYITTALGASEVLLLELANAYRAMASGVVAEPHVIDRVTDADGAVLYTTPRPARDIGSAELHLIQEGLRGVIRLPDGTAHSLDGGDFSVPVMGKTGTTNDFRDALFVGSTYGPLGITVAVRIGFDDNRTLGDKETGGRVALPIFREIMRRIYSQKLVGPVPQFPRDIEDGIGSYLAQQAALELGKEALPPAPVTVSDALSSFP
jgi:penicillin-binding protein 1A